MGLIFRTVNKIFVPKIAGIMCLIFLAACKDAPKQARTTSHIRMMNEKIIKYHQGIVASEEQEIVDFIARHRWNMVTLPTGLRYMIYQKGTGKVAKAGWEAAFNYETRLLTGKLLYSSDSTGIKKILLGRGEVERGLEEGLLQMRVGDRAKLILPSFLAFGLLGDQDRIPPGAILVYDIQLVDLKQMD